MPDLQLVDDLLGPSTGVELPYQSTTRGITFAETGFAVTEDSLSSAMISATPLFSIEISVVGNTSFSGATSAEITSIVATSAASVPVKGGTLT